MEIQPGRVLASLVRGPLELLVVAAVTSAGDLANGHVPGGEQAESATADTASVRRAGVPGIIGCERSRGLHLRFLVHAQHQGCCRWVQVQADQVTDLVDELRIR
ncbi:hypothetical protein [Nocardia carnea]|uniref:hypothetical protein n=1 Tax=Nocardia carnea TaxID=37328 RepID=UPI003D789899